MSAARFARDTARHEMTVLHDDGLYRHLQFRQPRPASSFSWFELITWPGCLTVRGDFGDAYTFARERDMLDFFPSRTGPGINPHYWSEKVGRRCGVMQYDTATFEASVKEYVAEAIRDGWAPRGIGKAVHEEILSDPVIYDEIAACKLLEQFDFKGFRFPDVWEQPFTGFAPSFLWACHAIVWGIRRYDKVRRYGLQRLAEPAPAREAVAP